MTGLVRPLFLPPTVPAAIVMASGTMRRNLLKAGWKA
jgi:hypothetical protein